MLQNDVEIPIPNYFLLERTKALTKREKLLGQVLARLGPQELERVSVCVWVCGYACTHIYVCWCTRLYFE